MEYLLVLALLVLIWTVLTLVRMVGRMIEKSGS